MRGWTFTNWGSPSSILKLREDLPKPSSDCLAPNDVLIKVAYTGIFGGYAAMIKMIPHINSKPWIPELEFSGTVVDVGSKVTNVVVGDEVFGGQDLVTHMKFGGVAVEYLVISADLVVRKPDNVSMQEAAALSVNGCTIMQFLNVTKLKEGDKVLVTAASSGMGTIMVQAARSVVGKRGIVVGTCSGANAEMVRKLGVDEVIDYTQYPNLHEHLKKEHSNHPFDVIVDIAGSDDQLYPNSPSYLKPSGIFLFAGNINVTIKNGGSSFFNMIGLVLRYQIRMYRPVLLGGVPRNCTFHSGRIDKDTMRKLEEFVRAGYIKGVIDSVWSMEDLIKAYEYIATGRAKGKCILRVLS